MIDMTMWKKEHFQTEPAKPGSLHRDCSAAGLVARINNYLQVGGLFNPEMMEHDKVRDLLLDCREALTRQQNAEL
jgi:hypothetical protein